MRKARRSRVSAGEGRERLAAGPVEGSFRGGMGREKSS
jgi:hypothetical protein